MVCESGQAAIRGPNRPTVANEPRKLIAIRLNAKVSSHQRPILNSKLIDASRKKTS
jgi:hypothetical protein